MFTLPREKFVNIDNKLFVLVNNRWVWCLSVQYNTNNTITVYSMQYITK